MSVAEMTKNYARIRREAYEPKPEPKKPTPAPAQIVNLSTRALEKWLDEDAAFGPKVYPKRKESISFDDVLRETCRHFAMTKNEIMAKRRDAEIVYPRQVAMFLAYRLCLKRSLPYIGMRFDKDHTTVMSARKKIQRLYNEGHQETIVAINTIAAAVGGSI